MIDLRNMPEENFSVSITPPALRSTLQLTINGEGYVSLNSKLIELFAKKPVQIRFTQDFSAMQITCVAEEDSFVFPKSGRKYIPEIVGRMNALHISFPAGYRGLLMENDMKWRGGRLENPTIKRSQTTHTTGKR